MKNSSRFGEFLEKTDKISTLNIQQLAVLVAVAVVSFAPFDVTDDSYRGCNWLTLEVGCERLVFAVIGQRVPHGEGSDELDA